MTRRLTMVGIPGRRTTAGTVTRRTVPVPRRRVSRFQAAAGSSLILPLLVTALVAMSAAAPVVCRSAEVSDLVLAAEQQRIDAIAKASACSVSVFARGGGGGGSGVVVTPDGYALTNFHVVKPAGSHMKCSMPDGVLYDAVIVGIDPVGDVALIKLLGRDDFPTAELGDSDAVRVGDWCFAIGNPFLLATDFQPTVTYGIVSGVHRYQYPAGTLLEYADCIQTDASINPGNSGGPLFNAKGQLIGINGRGSFEKRGRVNVGVGYAISINQIKHFMGYLKSGRIVDHATLGATVTTSDDGRVIVSNILPTSDAARRGVEYGDELVSFGGRAITTVNGFKNVLGIYPRGWRIPLSYRREGERFDIYVRLTGVHAKEELLQKVQQAPARPQPKPKDGKKPQDGRKPPKGDGKKPRPAPAQARPGKPPATPPEIAAMIQPRPGYANYYFNQLNRNRVWDHFLQGGDFGALKGVWKFEGELADGGKADLTLEEDSISGQFAGSAVRVDAAKDLDQQLDPQGSGGLLVALHLWRRMLQLGPQKYGDVHYLGTGPLLNRMRHYDVLVGTHDVTESRFYFDPDTGHMVALEMYPDMDGDPCEVYLDDYRDVQGFMTPHHLEVRFGNKVVAEINWKKIEFPQPAKSE